LKTNAKISIGCLIILAILILVIAAGCVVSSFNEGVDEIDIDHKKPKSPSASVSAPKVPGATKSPAAPTKAVTAPPKPVSTTKAPEAPSAVETTTAPKTKKKSRR